MEKSKALTEELVTAASATEEVVAAAVEINNLSQESMRSVEVFQQGASEIAKAAEKQARVPRRPSRPSTSRPGP
ncbi:hypothetical protein [Thermodesulfitimonas sp.]